MAKTQKKTTKSTTAKKATKKAGPKKVQVVSATKNQSSKKALSVKKSKINVLKSGAKKQSITNEAKRNLTAKLAYRLAEQRGFAGGSEQDDWFRAEKQVVEQLGHSV